MTFNITQSPTIPVNGSSESHTIAKELSADQQLIQAPSLRVLMIAPQPFFEPRGTPISVFQRLRALSELGHKVDLLTYHIGQDVTFTDISVHRIPNIPLINRIKIGPSWAKLILDIFLFIKTFMLLLTNRYDIIHTHEEAAYFAMPLAKLFKIPHLYDMHSSLPRQLDNFKFANYRPVIGLVQILERLVLHTCDGLITIGADLEQYAKQINPQIHHVRIENLAVHDPNESITETGAELRYQWGLNDKNLIVYTGTFERYQGLDLLLESIQKVIEKYPNTMLILVGGNTDQIEFWRSEAKKLNLEENVIFTGQVSPAEASIYQVMADILVSPRIGGTSVPLKIYSYLFAEKPIVATDIVAHSQVLNSDIALLTPPEAEAFAAGILKLLQDKPLADRLGEQAKCFVQERFNPEDYLLKISDIYKSVSKVPESYKLGSNTN